MTRQGLRRWLVALPGPLVSAATIAATREGGAAPLLDFQAPRPGELEAAARRCPGRVSVRLFEPSEAALAEVVRLGAHWDLVWLSADRALGEEGRLLAGAGLPIGAVVSTPDEVRRLMRRPDLPIIARGNEAGGFVGPIGTFVLLQVLRRWGRAPFWLEGGLGLAGAVAAVGEGAAGAVFGVAVHGLLPGTVWHPPVVPGQERREPLFIPDQDGGGYRCLTPGPADPLALRRKLAGEARWTWPDLLPDGTFPCGQDLVLAAGLERRFPTFAAFVAELERMVAAALAFLRPGAALSGCRRFADALGAGRGLIQGPMARISENVAFLKAVEEGGGVPVLAFGSCDEEAARRLWRAARAAGLRAGVGVIGLELQRDLVERQRVVLQEVPPLFVLVAAPRPDLVGDLRADGHRVLAHAYEPRVLKMLAEAECRWFVLEGSESGGHIGRLSSAVLWERTLEELPALDPTGEIRLVFAGGIATPVGVRFIQRMVAAHGLADRLDWGIQIGTAYLATREIVDTGAMSREYRNRVLNHDLTLVTGESVRLRARQVATPFVQRILAREEELLRSGVPLPERRAIFERENIGNLANAVVAAEGEDGCFMAGESVALLDRLLTIAELHESLLPSGEEGRGAFSDSWGAGYRPPVANSSAGWPEERSTGDIWSRTGNHHEETVGPIGGAGPGTAAPGATEREERSSPGSVTAAARPETERRQSPGPAILAPGAGTDRAFDRDRRAGGSEPIAVIGLGCVFPGSFDPIAYFRHILQGKCFVRPLPPDRLDPAIWYDPDRQAPVASYTRLGAWVEGFVFDPVPFRIPPRVAARLDLTQQLALVAARQALAAAGLLEGDFDHDRTAVIIGNSMGGVASVDNLRAIHFHEFLARGQQAGLLPSDDAFVRQYQELIRPVPITEDSLPGELSSLVAGRISAVFDLHGPNFTVDAACGSGLAAVIAGVDALRQGRVDLVLAGGADTQMDPGSFVKFSKVTALSATGSFPFDARGDGFIMGEGAGLVVLERLSDARRLEHPVLAVIYGVGQASDGKGKGITAPNPAGQRRALERAWTDAGLSPRAAAYFEAHGTGTVVGDAIELRALADFLREAPPLDPALAVEAGAPAVLPRAAAEPAAALEALPAVGSVKAMIGHAKAAAGAAGLLKAILCCNRRVIPPQPNFERLPDSLAAEALPFYIPRWGCRFGGRRFVAGVSSFGFGGTDHHVVLGEPVDGPVAPFDLGDDLEALLATPPNRNGVAPDATVPVVSSSGQAWPGRSDAETGSASGGRGEARPAAQAHPSDSPPAGAVDPATIAVVFPGQGSQYLRMLAAWRDEPPFAAVLEVAEEVFRTVNGESLREAIYPPAGIGADEEERRSLLLQSTLYAQPAMFAVSAGLLEVVRARGLRFGMAFGHSLGEYTALYAAGILPLRSALQAVCLRGRYMNAIPGDDLGAMAVVGLPAAAVREGLEGIPGYLICSNLNSPTQTVLSGATAAIEAAVRRFEARGVLARRLPVSAAFHSEMVAPAVPLFAETLAGLEIGEGSVPVPANVTGAWYPSRAGPPRENGGDPRQEVIRLLTAQAVSPVDFIGQVERAWAAGIRTFVEVGPKNVLGRLIAEILAGRPHTCLMLDHPRQDSRALVRQALIALGVERPSASEAVGARRPSSAGDRPGTSSATTVAAGRGGSRRSEGEAVAAAAHRAPATQVAGGPSGRSAATEFSSEMSVSGPDDTGSTSRRSAAGVAGAVDPPSVEAIVRETIAMVSGYPAAMIQPDLDLEADLGIDTLKIFEIGSRLREAFPALGQGRLELGRLRTVRRLVELIVERSAAAPPAVVEGAGSAAAHGMPGPSPAGAAAASPSMIGRYRVTWRRFPALSTSPGASGEAGPDAAPALFAPGERVVVKTAGVPAFEQALQTGLAEQGLEVHLWTPDEADLEQLESGQTPPGLQAARHYVHLLPRTRFGRKTRKRFYREEILSLFMVARRLGRTNRSLIVLTDLGGEPPAQPDPARPDFLRGVLSGFLASAGKDFPNLAVRGLDLPAFDPAVVPAALAALHALAVAPNSPVVVGLPAAEEWAAEAVEPQPLNITPEAVLAGLRGCLGPTTTILATGGGGGVLRPLLRRLAREFHCRIVVLGRAPDRHDLLADLREAGGETVYLPCNLADGPAVDRTGEIIRRLCPRIDVLIHAAGLESSRNLANKTPAEIDEIYRVKVAGLVNLLEAIGEERIGLVVNFSSVASLFGNPGQADYAAANGFLNHYRGSGRTRFLTIAWTAWAGAGMAARGPIAEILRANQVDFIEPGVGERLFLQELHQALVADPAPARTVAYFGRLGANLAPVGTAWGMGEKATTGAAGLKPGIGQSGFSSDCVLSETGIAPAGGKPSGELAPRGECPGFGDSQRPTAGSGGKVRLAEVSVTSEDRLADAVVAREARDAWNEADRALSAPAKAAPESLTLLVDPQRGPWVLDHAIGGRAILPAVVSLEAVWSEQVQGLSSLPTSLKMSQVVFHAPVKFTAQETVHLWTEPTAGGLALWAQVKPEHGRPPRHHLTCAIEPGGLDVADRRRLVEGERRARFRLEEDPGEMRLTRRCLSRFETYRVLFHGPAFQVLGDTLAYNRRALRVEVASGADRAACAPLLAGAGIPFALEAALHAAGVMCLLQVWQREFFLPHRIDTVLLDLAALQRAAPATATVEFLGATVETSGPMPLRYVRCHVFLADAAGIPVGALLGLQMVGGPDSPADPRTLVTSGVPFQVGGWPFMGVLVADVAPWLADPDRLARVLSPAERSRIKEFPVDKRRLEWLAGRVALKSLLQEMVRERLSLAVAWPDLTIVSEQAAPRVIPGQGCDPRVAAFLKDQVFSIAHGGGLAVATAASHPIGIDIEPLAPLAAGVADRFLTPAERAGVPSSEWLALWTAKEAAAKALGLGFGVGDFTRLEGTGIVYNEPYALRVAGRSTPLWCLTFKDREFVVSLAWEQAAGGRSG